MPPTQQYPVTSGTANFYPGTSPAEYSPYGKGFPLIKHNHPSKTTIIRQYFLKYNYESYEMYPHTVTDSLALKVFTVALLVWLVCLF